MEALNITLNTPNTTEYRLMYIYGGWHTDIKIFAESDKEAIFDADARFAENKALRNWKYSVVLWDYTYGRRVKQYR